MSRSKMLFCIIAAIVVIAVIVVVVLKPGAEQENPTGPSATEPSVPGVDGTIPDWDMTEPSSGISNLFPTNPVETSPVSVFVPDEDDAGDLPESNESHYMNHGNLGVNVTHDDRLFLITFGIYAEGPNDYLYLNPHVEVLSDNASNVNDFQFRFTPSSGYVTTITDAEPGDYMANNGSSTFIRALDYALPSAYISESCPGTVWYTDKDVLYWGEEEYCVSIDVQVFCKGEFLATLRLLLMQDVNGTYFMVGVSNLNQLEEGDIYMDSAHRLTEDQLDTLLELAKNDACTDRIGYAFREEDVSSLTEEDFIVEWRAVGQGTYFEFTSDIPRDSIYIASEELANEPLVAVSIRMANPYAKSPMTLYYRFVIGFGASEGAFELVGIDSPNHYYLRSLYYGKYPGYSES